MTTEKTMIEPEIHDLIRTLSKQQMDVLAKGSVLRREQKALGELKKERDATIAELVRLEVNLSNMTLPLGLKVNERGYIVTEDTKSAVPDPEDGGEHE